MEAGAVGSELVLAAAVDGPDGELPFAADGVVVVLVAAGGLLEGEASGF
jgi:hypothetical protein